MSDNGSAPDVPLEVVHGQLARAAIADLFVHRDQTGQLLMVPQRDQLLKAMVVRQAVIMNALALVLDELIVARGEVHGVKLLRKEEQQSAPGPRLVVPA